MADKYVLGKDLGKTEYFIPDPNDGKFHIETVQDVEPILNSNKEAQGTPVRSKIGGWEKAAFIPNVILLQWMTEWQAQGIDFYNATQEQRSKLLKEKLNDPDWKYLRTDNKRI